MNKCLTQNGHCSHILTILIDDSVCQEERTNILLAVHNLLKETVLVKDVDGLMIPLKWNVSEPHRYCTDVMSIFSDECVLRHTKSRLRDMQQSINKNNFKVIITKKQYMV